MIDVSFILNLARQPERLAHIQQQVAEHWPFGSPIVIPAIDGFLCQPPFMFPIETNAPRVLTDWGCLRSHINAIETALNCGYKSLAIIEDDCVFQPNFREDMINYANRLPNNWDIASIGYNNIEEPEFVKDGVYRVVHTNLFHCWAISERALLRLYQAFMNRHQKYCYLDGFLYEVRRNFNWYVPAKENNNLLAYQRNPWESEK